MEHNPSETSVQNHLIDVLDPVSEREQLTDKVESSTLGMENMVQNAAGTEFDSTRNRVEELDRNTKKFMNLMDSANEKVYPGAEYTMLEAVAELLNIKAESNMSQHTYNRIMSFIQRLLPKENNWVNIHIYEEYVMRAREEAIEEGIIDPGSTKLPPFRPALWKAIVIQNMEYDAQMNTEVKEMEDGMQQETHKSGNNSNSSTRQCLNLNGSGRRGGRRSSSSCQSRRSSNN